MAVLVGKQLYTGQEVYEVNSQGLQQYELVNGELAEVAPVSAVHGIVALRLGGRLSTFVEENNLGWATTETGYYLQHNPDIVRGPDVGFMLRQRMPRFELTMEGYVDSALDMAAEVVSPNDTPRAILRKTSEYLKGGVPLIWIIYPKEKLVNVVGPDQPLLILDEKDYLDGFEVIPGFKLPLNLLFKADD